MAPLRPQPNVGNPNDIDVADEETRGDNRPAAAFVPIFLKKTFQMITECNSSIASWTEDGNMFVVKQPETLAATVIPKYFDHNKFSSFARQLNFYGFRKLQARPICNTDFDAETAKHITFVHEYFRRDRKDLLRHIQRSTRGGASGTANGQDQQREIRELKDQVSTLEQKLAQVTEAMEDMRLNMLARMEQMELAIERQQNAQLQLQAAAAVGTRTSSPNSTTTAPFGAAAAGAATNPTSAAAACNIPISMVTTSVLPVAEGNSVPSQINSVSATADSVKQAQAISSEVTSETTLKPTLKPHANQKSLHKEGRDILYGTNHASWPPSRDVSEMSHGMSVSRGPSVDSNGSALHALWPPSRDVSEMSHGMSVTRGPSVDSTGSAFSTMNSDMSVSMSIMAELLGATSILDFEEFSWNTSEPAVASTSEEKNSDPEDGWSYIKEFNWNTGSGMELAVAGTSEEKNSDP